MDPVLDITLRGALALLFGAAAVHKLRAPVEFQEALAGYGLVPARASRGVAFALVLAELGCASAFLLPGLAAQASLAAVSLLGLYSAAIGMGLARGRRGIDCGCATLRQPLGPGLLVRNAVLAGGALAILLPVAPRPLLWVDAVSVAGASLVLVALYASANRLLAGAPAPARLRSAP